MVKGMWYDPVRKIFGCDGHSKCYVKCLLGKGSANANSPNCGAFHPTPSWAKEFRCPRFVYRKVNNTWRCIHDALGIIAPAEGEH